MDKSNNLNVFLKDVADAIREKKNSTALINPQNFSKEIKNLSTISSSSTSTQIQINLKLNDIY